MIRISSVCCCADLLGRNHEQEPDCVSSTKKSKRKTKNENQNQNENEKARSQILETD